MVEGRLLLLLLLLLFSASDIVQLDADDCQRVNMKFHQEERVLHKDYGGMEATYNIFVVVP